MALNNWNKDRLDMDDTLCEHEYKHMQVHVISFLI